MVSDCIASIEIACKKKGLRFIDAEQILARGGLERMAFPVTRDRSLVPDALFGIEYESGAILYAVECDRKTEQLQARETGSSYEKKLRDYDTVIKTKDYQRLMDTRAGLMVLHITVAEPRKIRMMKLAGAACYNLYKTVPFGAFGGGRPLASLFLEAWDREGYESFKISSGAS